MKHIQKNSVKDIALEVLIEEPELFRPSTKLKKLFEIGEKPRKKKKKRTTR